jgi:hypothetical protein
VDGLLGEEEKMRKITWVIAIATVVVLSCLIALGAYAKVSAPGPKPGGSRVLQARAANPLAAAAVPQPASVVSAQLPPADAILESALSTLAGLDSWHVEMGMDLIASFRSLAMEAPLSYAGDFQAPDRLEGAASVRLLGMTLNKDIVWTANTMHASDESGVTVDSMFSLLSFGRFEMADIQNLEFVGEETLDEVAVYHLKGELQTDKEQPATGATGYGFEGGLQFEVWIGVADRLPRQIVADGELTTWGPAEGTIQVGASATFSGFGQPTVGGPVILPPAPAENPCEAAGEGFVAYRDEAQGIGFCYPAGWVVDDLVDEHGFIALSPDGVGYGEPLPKSLLVIYPPATVSGFGHWTVGAVEVVARPAVAFYGWVRQALQPGDTSGTLVLNFETITRIAQWVLSDGPLVGGLTGTQDSAAKAVTLGGTVEGDAHGSTVEAILSSVVVEAADSR